MAFISRSKTLVELASSNEFGDNYIGKSVTSTILTTVVKTRKFGQNIEKMKAFFTVGFSTSGLFTTVVRIVDVREIQCKSISKSYPTSENSKITL